MSYRFGAGTPFLITPCAQRRGMKHRPTVAGRERIFERAQKSVYGRYSPYGQRAERLLPLQE